MQKIVVKKDASCARLEAVEAGEPQPEPGELLVDVHTISLNRGEVSAALLRAADGWTPGWDFAGVVARSAANGAGPQAGARVVGFLESGSWAQRIAVDAASVAVVPDGVSLETAATLPVAGLTALYALEKAGPLAGKQVLVTGATGGMGQFAVQLGLLQGAFVTAAVYRNSFPDLPLAYPGNLRVTGSDESGLAAIRERKYDLVIEGVGGDVFTAAVESLAPGGTLVALGATSGRAPALDIRNFFNTGRATIYGFMIFEEVADKPASVGLRRLLDLVQRGMLAAPVTYTGPIREVDRVARDLLESKIPGKAVLKWAS